MKNKFNIKEGFTNLLKDIKERFLMIFIKKKEKKSNIENLSNQDPKSLLTDFEENWEKRSSMMFILGTLGLTISQLLIISITSGTWKFSGLIFSWTQVLNDLPFTLIFFALALLLVLTITKLIKLINSPKGESIILGVFYLAITLLWYFGDKIFELNINANIKNNVLYGLIVISIVVMIVIFYKFKTKTINNPIGINSTWGLLIAFTVTLSFLLQTLISSKVFEDTKRVIEIKDKEYDSIEYYSGYELVYQNDKWSVLRNGGTGVIILPSSRIIAIKNSPFELGSSTGSFKQRINLSGEIKISTGAISK